MEVRYLYHMQDTRKAGDHVYEHRHTHWQFEWLQEGSLCLQLPENLFVLKAGEFLVIPPTVSHSIVYDEPCQFLSIKFDADEWQIPDILRRACRPGRVVLHLCEALKALLGGQTLLTENSQVLASQLLTALLAAFDAEYAESVHHDKVTNEPLVNGVQYWLDRRGGGYLTVGELAGHLKVTPNYLSARYRQLTGQSLKLILDKQRLSHALAMLRYADLSIKEIAVELEFSCVQAFSAFISRMTGYPPGHWRSHYET